MSGSRLSLIGQTKYPEPMTRAALFAECERLVEEHGSVNAAVGAMREALGRMR
jgi:hypothetical protein